MFDKKWGSWRKRNLKRENVPYILHVFLCYFWRPRHRSYTLSLSVNLEVFQESWLISTFCTYQRWATIFENLVKRLACIPLFGNSVHISWKFSLQFTQLSLNPKHVRVRNLRLLVLTYYSQISRNGIISKLLNKWGLCMTSWIFSRDFSGKYFLLFNFLLEMLNFIQAIKLTFRCNKFSKMTVYNC